MKGFIALDSHPDGCARQVAATVEQVADGGGRALPVPGPVVVVGASGGYGLPATAVAAFRYGAPVIGVCLERGAQRGRTATAGWYNVGELHGQSGARGRHITVLNADCFADETKDAVVDQLARLGQPPSLLVYSVAAPVRTDPESGVTYRSVLKPIGAPFTTKTVKIDNGSVDEATLAPATDDEIDATVRVMGGADWARWIDALDAASLIGEGFRTVAFDYIGPEATHPIYRDGTIGKAKLDLEQTAQRINGSLSTKSGGAWTSVNAAAVTQSSSAIPAVPLYLSLLLSVTRGTGTFETPTRQMTRLFDEHLSSPTPAALDAEGRIRLDEWELAPPVQAEIARRWEIVTDDTFGELADFATFQRRFRQLFGFDVDGVDYERPVQVDQEWPAG